MSGDRQPFLYAPIRACLRGPRNDPRTVAVLVVPTPKGAPVVARMPLPADGRGDAVARAREQIIREAHDRAAAREADPEELVRWWMARASQRADFVWLERPMAGSAVSLEAEAEGILAEYVAP